MANHDDVGNTATKWGWNTNDLIPTLPTPQVFYLQSMKIVNCTDFWVK